METNFKAESETLWKGSDDLRALLVRLDTLRPDPANLNEHSAHSYAQIALSYAEFGQLKPLVVTDDGLIVAGHGQYEAAKTLGWTHVAVSVFAGDALAHLRFAIADNATQHLSQFKEEPLLLALRELGPLPGFDQKSVDMLLLNADSRDAANAAAFDVADAFDANPDATKVLPGQLWQFGAHRLLCADVLHPDTLPALLQGETPVLIFADPPYGIDCVKTSGALQGRGRNDVSPLKMVGILGFGETVPTERGFGESAKTRKKATLLGSIGGTKPYGTNKGGRAVAATKYAPVIGDETAETAYAAFTLLTERFPRAFHVWWGANHYASILPNSPCWLFWNKEMTGNFADGELAYTNGKKAVRMFTHQWNGLMKASERGVKRVHPNQKPTALAAWVFEQYAACGENCLVLDPFLGSAPSVWAAETLGMKVYGCELSPDYCALILAKWEGLTGGQAVLIAEGIALSAVEKQEEEEKQKEEEKQEEEEEENAIV